MVTSHHRAAEDAVIQSLAHVKSGITISFDHWKANNDVLDLLGVVAHYLDREYKPKTVVIALKNTLGSHTGENIAEQLIEVLRDYDICHRVTYLAADNATKTSVGGTATCCNTKTSISAWHNFAAWSTSYKGRHESN